MISLYDSTFYCPKGIGEKTYLAIFRYLPGFCLSSPCNLWIKHSQSLDGFFTERVQWKFHQVFEILGLKISRKSINLLTSGVH